MEDSSSVLGTPSANFFLATRLSAKRGVLSASGDRERRKSSHPALLAYPGTGYPGINTDWNAL